jgi:hypothetical protein
MVNKCVNVLYILFQNVVAVGAGIADGLGFGDNTKAAVIRLGLMEMITFVENFYPGLLKSGCAETNIDSQLEPNLNDI